MSIQRLVMAAEASPSTGLGHFVRCCALGDAAQRRGWGVTVLLRPDALEWARAQVLARGWTLASGDFDPAGLAGTLRQGGSLDQTALVIDSYLVDETSISRMRGLTGRLLVIDDVADRYLDADIVVNQNLGGDDLPVRLGAGTVLLAGPTFALLRPEFPAHRAAALDAVNRLPDVPARILVMMGGTDPTGSALTVAQACMTAFPGASVAAVLPGSAGTRTVGRLTELPRVENVAQHMMEADLVVTAAGSTVWELSCLARPVAALEMAGNQSDVYRRLVADRLVLGLGRPPVNKADLVTALKTLTGMPGELRRLAAAAARLVDGRGADRVLDHTEAVVMPPRAKETQ